MGLRAWRALRPGGRRPTSPVSISFFLTAAAVLRRTRQAVADAGRLARMCGTPRLGPQHRTGSRFSRALTGITLAVRSFLCLAFIWIYYAAF
jgi:hypothetical protein